jgi:hypothetical protein
MRYLHSQLLLAVALTALVTRPCIATEISNLDYKVETGTLTPDLRKVKSPYAPDKKPFAYLSRIQPPPPAPPKYIILDLYTSKLFYLPSIAPTIFQNGDRYSFTPDWDGNEYGMTEKQFLNLGVMNARYNLQAVAPPIHLPIGDLDESVTPYDPSAPPEFLATAGWQSADVYKAIDKSSEAGFPVHGDPTADDVHRTSIYYTKAAAAYRGLALTVTYLESADSIRPRQATSDALLAGEERLQRELDTALAGGPVAQELLEAQRILGPKASAEAQQGHITTNSIEKLEKLLLRNGPAFERYREVDLALNYSHEIVPGYFDATVGYVALLDPDPAFYGTGFDGEFDGTVAFTRVPHVRPSVTFTLFNSAVAQLRGRYYDFRCETYGLTVFKSELLQSRMELDPYVALGVDDGFIGDGVDWSDFRFGVRAPVYIGSYAILNMDINYSIPINGNSESSSNFRTDLGQVGVWGGVSMSFKF